MNRILVLVVIVLIPITLVTDQGDTQEVVGFGATLENKKLEIETEKLEKDIEVANEQEKVEVLVSNNIDKSAAYKIDLEDYVYGVVAGEMPASFNMEALKAQAVAARTYALYKLENIDGYVLSATINDQVYLSEEEMKVKWKEDYQYYSNRIKEAVKATEGEVLTYNDDLIIAYYFAISNGYTDTASNVFNEDKEYLVSVPSTWDKNYQSYVSTWTTTKSNFCNKLGLVCGDIVIGDILRASNNYIRKIEINGNTFSGLDVFNKLALRSTDFNISVDKDNVIITTYGFGHSVGMSQYGAQGMASEGYNYQEILTYYYKNTKIDNI